MNDLLLHDALSDALQDLARYVQDGAINVDQMTIDEVRAVFLARLRDESAQHTHIDDAYEHAKRIAALRNTSDRELALVTLAIWRACYI